jgi:hypothetical protein
MYVPNEYVLKFEIWKCNHVERLFVVRRLPCGGLVVALCLLM